MIEEHQDFYNRVYKSEKNLIWANKGDENAIRIRYDDLEEQKQKFNNEIIFKSIEFIARESALQDQLIELRQKKDDSK